MTDHLFTGIAAYMFLAGIVAVIGMILLCIAVYVFSSAGLWIMAGLVTMAFAIGNPGNQLSSAESSTGVLIALGMLGWAMLVLWIKAAYRRSEANDEAADYARARAVLAERGAAERAATEAAIEARIAAGVAMGLDAYQREHLQRAAEPPAHDAP